MCLIDLRRLTEAGALAYSRSDQESTPLYSLV
jgi:hypothetical protein